MPNANHPRKGSIIAAEPLRSHEMVEAIEGLLKDKPRDLDIFVLGINTNLRASDLLRLTVGMMNSLVVGSTLTIREKKTQKVRSITINKKVFSATQAWLEIHPWSDQDEASLFPNYRTGKSLTVATLSRMVKRWCQQAGFKGRYSAHTLRKTFGYLHRKIYGTDIPTLMTMFNHSSQKQTLNYLCIDDEDVRDAYMKEI